MSSTPDFQWASLYYPQARSALLALKRRSWPEHTEEDEHDPVIRVFDAFAVLAHQGAVRLDHAARESFWATLQRRPSAVAKARLVDRDLLPAGAAEVDVVADLTAGLTASTPVIAARSVFATEDGGAEFDYDSATALTVSATGAWDIVQDDGGTFTVPSLPASLWAGVPADGDALYIGHDSAMFDRVLLHIDVAGAGILVGRWEYYDPTRKGQPDFANQVSGNVEVKINTVFGSTQGTGGEVVVTCLLTGESETVTTTWASPYNIALCSSSLGQSVVSTNPADYEVKTTWTELPGLTDGATSSEGLDTVGEEIEVSWDLPQETDRKWEKTTLEAANAASEINSDRYWIRYRVVSVDAVTSAPTVDAAGEPADVTYSVLVPAKQGRQLTERLGVTDSGTAGQTFDLARLDFMELVELRVAGTAWTQVDTLVSSASRDKHFRLREEPDGTWRVTFGDGTNGKIPVALSTVEVDYRAGGTNSGNVGPSTITRDRSGNARIKNVRNPRSGEGWTEKEGASEASLEVIRETVPASLRVLRRAVTPEDHEDLAVAYRDTDGQQLVARALAVEEGNGLKTIALKCVAPSGSSPGAAELSELDEYFNGELNGVQRVGGVGLHNTEVTAEGVNLASVDVTATVEVLADYASTAEAAMEAGLGAILTPIATRDDLYGNGSTGWLWEWGDNGGKVTDSQIKAAMALAAEGVISISLSAWSDVVLAAGQLPTKGTISLTITPV